MTVVAIVFTAGSGSRMAGALAKQYRDLEGRPVLSRTLEAFTACPAVDRIRLMVPSQDLAFCGTNHRCPPCAPEAIMVIHLLY